MGSLVLEIQEDAIKKDSSVSDLLRKAFVVAKKLNVAESEWIESELNGYADSISGLPSYRQFMGIPKVWNPYHGEQPLRMPTDMTAKVCKIELLQSAAQLESFVKDKQEGNLRFNFSPARAEALMRGMQVPLEPYLAVAPSTVIGVIDIVRNRILKWALELEKAGVLGDGLSFSRDEMQKAQGVTYHTVNNIGVMQNSQLQQHSSGTQKQEIDGATVVELLELLEAVRQAAVIGNSAEAKEIAADAHTAITQLNSPKPKLSIVQESLKSLRAVAEGAGGEALGDTVKGVFPRLLALIAELVN